MIEWLAVVASGLGTGFASAVFPLVNVELATGAAAWQFETPLALAAVVALALGQTAGKVVVYQAARGGRTLGHRWRLRRAERARTRPEPTAETALPAGTAAEAVAASTVTSDALSVPVSPASSAPASSPARAPEAGAAEAGAAEAGAAQAPGTPTADPDRVVELERVSPGPGRLKALGNKLLAAMDKRWRSNAVLLLSAVVGIPPLFATSIAAGLLRLRLLDFVLCVSLGRIARLMVIAWPVLALT
ncbi:MAG: hypothetical protein LBC97_05940 [Bifidobacteriaceae bacterium]|jgi:membrane protein YqaA with SNARE-associated domain|nr:hypothetical protein [Bifidobacteriaceae bacterium]